MSAAATLERQSPKLIDAACGPNGTTPSALETRVNDLADNCRGDTRSNPAGRIANASAATTVFLF